MLYIIKKMFFNYIQFLNSTPRLQRGGRKSVPYPSTSIALRMRARVSSLPRMPEMSNI